LRLPFRWSSDLVQVQSWRRKCATKKLEDLCPHLAPSRCSIGPVVDAGLTQRRCRSTINALLRQSPQAIRCPVGTKWFGQISRIKSFSSRDGKKATNPRGTKPPGENCAIDPVAIADDILRGGFRAEGLGELPDHPFGIRMGRLAGNFAPSRVRKRLRHQPGRHRNCHR
jgi:hypothetical protein